MANITAIHHVSLLVSDTGRALGFYQGLLGLEIDDSRPAMNYPGAWLRIGAAQIHLLELPDSLRGTHLPEHGGRAGNRGCCLYTEPIRTPCIVLP